MLKRATLVLVVVFASMLSLIAEPDYVYHERTNNVHCGGVPYVDIIAPTSSESVQIAFKVNFQFYWDQARIYYTTDGTNPDGSFNNPTGTTQVVMASYNCGSNPGGGIEEIVVGTIPNQPAGTTVKYIVSAWHSGGQDEIFGNGCGNCGSENRPASNATIFQYTVAGPAPVELSEFALEETEDGLLLSWKTGAELNNHYFEVQKSKDGTTFASIGNVESTFNSISPQQYTFLDSHYMGDLSYYRLKDVAFDGSIGFSDLVSVGNSSTNYFKIYPNPFQEYFVVEFDCKERKVFDVEILNLQGIVVHRTRIEFQQGKNYYRPDTPDLLYGAYYLRFDNKYFKLIKSE